MDELKKAWNGEEALWRVFWLYYIVLGLGLALAAGYLFDLSLWAGRIGYAVALLWSFWAIIAVWRCSDNSEWRSWGIIARIVVVLALIKFGHDLYKEFLI